MTKPPASRAANAPVIAAAGSAGDLDAVAELFREYADGLGVDLSFQGFESEVTNLPGDYAPPRGVLLLASRARRVVGCVGVRPLDWPATAELKRLYVRPEARGHRLGVRLSRAAMQFAARAGYERLRLDTLPDMGDAQRLYAQLGFSDIPPYRPNPIAGTRYLECVLSELPPNVP